MSFWKQQEGKVGSYPDSWQLTIMLTVLVQPKNFRT